MVVTLGQQFSVLFALTRRAIIRKMHACNPTEHPPTQFCISQNVYSWERYVVTVPSALNWFRLEECSAGSTSNLMCPVWLMCPVHTRLIIIFWSSLHLFSRPWAAGLHIIIVYVLRKVAFSAWQAFIWMLLFLTFSVPTRKNYFTRWPISLVVCWTGKR